MDAETIIPVVGMMTGIIVPVSVFIWLYFESKDKNKTILEKEPIDYRRTGVVTLFTGIGLFLFGVFFLGSILKGVGALVAAIGAGQVLAGYLYPRESEELTNAVDAFEKK
jgi:Na+/H+ antiporter NhaD/arsenite permease-like protein